MAQVDGLKRELKGLPGRKGGVRSSQGGHSQATAGSDDEEDAGMLELRELLDRSKENEVGRTVQVHSPTPMASKVPEPSPRTQVLLPRLCPPSFPP